MGENLVVETYLAGKGRLENVVSSWTAMCSSKIREFYKRGEMDMRTTRISYYKRKLEKWFK